MLKLCEFQDSLYDAAAKAGARSVQLAHGRVSEASERMYGVDLDRWRNELIDATLVDPKELEHQAHRLVQRLQDGKELTVRHAGGTNLRLGLRGRVPDAAVGKVRGTDTRRKWNLVQLPAGVVTVGLDERVADGTFCSNVTNSVGVMDTIGEVSGGRWTFEDGGLKRFHYDRGHQLFAQSYGRAGPAGSGPGFFRSG